MRLNASPQVSALAVLGITGFLLISLGWYLLIAGGVPAGDFAADMLLGNRIRDEGVLLVGHYSRYEFNHPGPFWFYYNHLFELALEQSELSRTQAWLVGQTAMATLLVGFSSCGLSLFLLGRVRFLPAALTAFIICGYLGADLLNLWMPHRLIAPYTAFLVCCLLLIQGRLLLLPMTTLLAAVLIHGYATMPIFTLLPMALAGLLGWQAQKRAGVNRPVIAASIITSVIIAGLFVLPIVYDALYVSPSNLSKLLYAQHGFAYLPKPSWPDMLEFMRSLLPPSGLWLALGIGVTMLLALRPHYSAIRPALQASALLIGTALLLVLYYKRTPAPLYDFVALFSAGIAPLLLAIVLILALNETLSRFNQLLPAKILAVCACFFLVYLLAPFKQTPEQAEQKSNEFSEFADFIHSSLPREQIAAIDYSTHDQWGFMAGLLLELDRQNIKACTTWRHMAFLYTDAEVCPPEMRPQYQVVPADQCERQCLFRTLNHGLRTIRLQALNIGQPYDHNSQQLLFQSWYPAEPLHRWSAGNSSSIAFVLDKQAPLPTELTLSANSFGRQRVEVFLNEQRIYAGELSGADTTLNIPLQQKTIQADNNVLRFVLPDAQKPKTADPRSLSLAFKNLLLR